MWKYLEPIITVLAVIVSLVLSVVFKDNLIVAIVSATVAIVALQNASNICRDNSASKDIIKCIENVSQQIEDTTTLLTDKISVSSTHLHISELEKIEREFCNSGPDATIYIISNNLTMDKSMFLDEMRQNIDNNITYIYIVTSECSETVNGIKHEIQQGLRNSVHKREINKKFIIIEDDTLFLCTPKKYTVSIYDKGVKGDVNKNSLRGFCCAQDSIEQGVYYFEMSHTNTLDLKRRLSKYIEKKS